MTQQEIKDALLYSCAKAYSHNFMPINYIAYNEALEAIDQLADKGLVQRRTKQLAKRMEAQCHKYETAIKTNMKGGNRLVLFFNFLSQEYRGAEKKLTAIRNAIRKVVKQNGFPEHYHDVMVQLYLAVLLCKQACVIHDAFFEEWLNRTTYHFARYFPDERLTDIAAIIMQIEECVTRQLNINELNEIMEIKGKVHCFFEQSGTFKREFIKLGIPAEDYDIQNNFGETDHVIDLFAEIEKAYEGEQSIWDDVTPDDLVMAFFPCIYFSCLSQMGFGWHYHNYKNLSTKEKGDMILQRSANREKFFRLMVQMFAVVEMRGLRMVVENPWSMQHFLKANFIVPPSIVDKDRSRRGDGFKKPTAYWFWGCEPTHGRSYQPNKNVTRIVDCKHERGGGICSELRSTISPDYARNFICDFIIGKEQEHSERTLFDL